MLVPFEKGTNKIIQSVGLWITEMLKTLLDQFTATGNIEAIWKAFQLELTVEKIVELSFVFPKPSLFRRSGTWKTES